MTEELPRIDGPVGEFGGIILIIGACRRAQPSTGVTVPRQVFMYGVRKLANRVGEIAQQFGA